MRVRVLLDRVGRAGLPGAFGAPHLSFGLSCFALCLFGPLRAAGASVGRPGSDALPPPTARRLGGLPVPVWGVRGRARSHPRLLALWAGCRGRCGASGVGRSATPDCPPSGRAAGAGVGRPGSGAPPTPTARPLGGLPGRCGANGVGHSPTPNWPPSGRAAGAGVGCSGSGALPPPTARPLGGLPGPVWGVRGRALSHPRLLALWAGCRGRCAASGVRRSPTPDCPPSGRAAGAGVGRPGSDALPPPSARPLGGLLGPMWGVRGRALSHPRLPALWAGCWGRCGASAVERSPSPDRAPSGRAAGAGVGRPGSGPLPTPTAHPLGGLPGPVWGVRGRTLFHPRLPALWAGCRCRCGASGVGRSPNPNCPPFGRAAGLLCVCVSCLAGSGGLASRARLVRLTFPLAFLASLFACSAPSGLGLPCLWLLLGFFASCRTPPLFFFSLPPLCAPRCLMLCVFSGLGCPRPWRPVASPPPFFCFFCPPPPPCCLWRFLVSGCLWPLRPPPPFCFCFFSCPAAFFPAALLLCVFWGVVLFVPCPARSLCCAHRLCCFWWLVLLVPGVTAVCWGSAGGSGCPALSFGGVCRLLCPCLVWPSLGVLPVVSRSPVLCPVALCCRVVLCCGALSSFFFFFVPAGGAGLLLFPVGSGLRAGSGSFLFLCSACAVLCWCACAVALCSVLSCPRAAGWCFVLLPVVFVCLLLGLPVLCCLLVGPRGSWCRVSVACCGVSLGAVLRHVAARCAAWRCVVVRNKYFYQNDVSHGRDREKYYLVTILCERPRAKTFICVRLMCYSTTH